MVSTKQDYLIVIDMQNDFISGSLGSSDAQAILPKVKDKIQHFQGPVIFTMDTHDQDYLHTAEGQALPIEHCLKDTWGWQLESSLESVKNDMTSLSPEFVKVFEKPVFASLELAQYLKKQWEQGFVNSITLVGLCTDVCVISNALLLKAFLPELPIHVDSSCCAGVTKEKHEAALDTMRSCQIHVE